MGRLATEIFSLIRAARRARAADDWRLYFSQMTQARLLYREMNGELSGSEDCLIAYALKYDPLDTNEKRNHHLIYGERPSSGLHQADRD